LKLDKLSKGELIFSTKKGSRRRTKYIAKNNIITNIKNYEKNLYGLFIFDLYIIFTRKNGIKFITSSHHITMKCLEKREVKNLLLKLKNLYNVVASLAEKNNYAPHKRIFYEEGKKMFCF